MPERLAVLLLLMTCSLDLVHAESDNWDKCGGRLERALDSIRRDSSRTNRLEDEDQKLVYQQKLKTAPLEMIVSRIAVKVAQDLRVRGMGPWAKVDRCVYEPSNNSVQTRVIFNDLSVSGLVSLMPRNQNVDVAGESCRMSLRLRRAGVEFFTNPIARGRGQMRIRTESSFLEPRFASIYAYGCRPTRHDKQIKRQDKWPPYATNRPADDITPIQSATVAESSYVSEDYESPEPRELAALSTDEDVVILNENKSPSSFYSADPRLGIWRDNSWITKSGRSHSDSIPRRLRRDSAQAANKSDYVDAKRSLNFTFLEDGLRDRTAKLLDNVQELPTDKTSARQPREIFLDDNEDVVEEADSLARDWQSRDNVAREMEDIFLRGASEALTRYIEKQLHPAIKETLMLSMGYTISYG